MARKALGRGLRSLIPEAPAKVPNPVPEPGAATAASQPGDFVRQIDIDRIQPNRFQPREKFGEESLESLARSLKTEGVLQPVLVRPLEEGFFEIVAGERRWRAAQRAGLLKIPAAIRAVPDHKLREVALIENLQREQLNPIEEAQAYRTLIEKLGLSQQEVADRVGRQRATIANTLRLLSLSPPVQDLVRAGSLSMGHARALASLAAPADQQQIAARCVKEGLSVRQVESLVAALARGARTPAKRTPATDPNVIAAEENLQRALRTKVRIVRGRKAGRIELHYFSEEELQRLYDLLLESSRRKV